MDVAFRHLHMSSEQACHFMSTFSRMEYALEITKFVLVRKNSIAADWYLFAKEGNEQFLAVPSSELRGAVDYLLSNPPRRQHYKKDVGFYFIEMKVKKNDCILQQLLLMVRAVRNNLFHGGKYLPDGELDPGRNEKLVKSSLIILQACARLMENVQQAYER